jgi:hypothetical protein
MNIAKSLPCSLCRSLWTSLKLRNALFTGLLMRGRNSLFLSRSTCLCSLTLCF